MRAARRPRGPRSRWRRVVRIGLVAAVAVFLALQLVPYGWSHPNPPVVQDAPWPDAESAAIARESCYACHSNETDWPAYSYVAPFSWLVRRDVEDGRDELNFSTWDRDDGEADDAVEVDPGRGPMPPGRYTMIHRGARLSDDEADVLVAALEAMDAARSGRRRRPAAHDGSARSGGGDDSHGLGRYCRASAPMLRRISLGRSGSVRTSTTLTTPDASARSRAGRSSSSDSTRSP